MVRGWQSTPKQNDHLKSEGILWTGKMGENGQSFSRDSKVPWDQTVGSKIPLIFGSLSTGSPVGLVGLTPTGLNVQSGHCNSIYIVLEQCSCDQVDWKLKPGKHEGMFCLTSWNGIRLRLHFSCFTTKAKLGFLPLMKGRVRFPTNEKRRKDTSENTGLNLNYR